MTTASETITDTYLTRVTIRKGKGSSHVQLLLAFDNGSEPVSYGFTVADFKRFTKMCLRVDEAVSRQALDTAS